MTKRNSQRRLTPLLVALGIVAVGAIVAFAQGGKKTVRTGVEAATRGDGPQVAVTPVRAAPRKALTFYTGGVRDDLFSAPQPPAPVLKLAPSKPLPPPAPEIVDPFADYAYTGTVSVGGQMLALVENTKTKEGQYLRSGDPFLGGSVQDVSERTLTVKVGSNARTLAKTDNFSLTPLDKNAPYLNQQTPQPGQPNAAPGPPGAAPGQPGAGPSFPGMDRLPPAVQERIRQRWQNMTPEQQQQAQNRFMNRQFERGGRRGGFGRGGGGFGG